jgi:hypothetical protein
VSCELKFNVPEVKVEFQEKENKKQKKGHIMRFLTSVLGVTSKRRTHN